jgi:hypothetical protein
MNRHIQEPFTMAKHPELLHQINELSIAIKLHYYNLSENDNEDIIRKAQASTYKPTWMNVIEVLDKCYKVINDKRENPIKY